MDNSAPGASHVTSPSVGSPLYPEAHAGRTEHSISPVVVFSQVGNVANPVTLVVLAAHVFGVQPFKV